MKMTFSLKKQNVNVLYFIILLFSLGNLANNQGLEGNTNSLTPVVMISSTTTQDNSTLASANEGVDNSTCFFGNSKDLLAILQTKVNEYNNSTAIDQKKELIDIYDLSAIFGSLEGFFFNKNKESLFTEAKKLEEFRTKYSFVETAALLHKKNATSQGDYLTFFDSLDKEMTKISEKKSYASFYTESVRRLISYVRGFNFMKTTPENKCYPIYLVEILNLAVNDPSDPKNIYLSANLLTADDYKINPNDFSVSGIAASFLVITDVTIITSEAIPVVQGFFNNEKKFEHTISQGSETGSIIHKFSLNGNSFEMKFETKCTEVFLITISFEKNVDQYKVLFIVKNILSNNRKMIETKATSKTVENLKLNFIKPIANEPVIFKNFKHSAEQEIKSTAYMTNAMSTFEMDCGDDKNCAFFSAFTQACMVCNKNTFNLNGKCVSTCTDGTFTNIQSRSCDKCQNNCMQCKSANQCDKCSKGYLLPSISNSQCVDKCPLGFFNNDSTKTCESCPKNCNNCSNSSTCIDCSSNFILHKGGCVDICPNGFYLQYSPKTCKSCQDGCESCLSFEKCSKCQEGFFMKNGVCVKNCGESLYGESNTRTCKSCVKNCKDCSNDIQCQTCLTGFSVDYSTNQCSTPCKCGEILFKGACIRCGDDNCDVCDYNNINFCKKCDKGYVTQEGKCNKSCDEGYFANDQSECIKCSRNCKVCNKDKCLLCLEGTFLLNDQECPRDCPEGFITSGKTCIKCTNSDCQKCSTTNLEVCVSCYPGQLLKEGKCVKECGKGYFAKDSSTCDKCFSGCEKCNDRMSCDQCITGLFLKDGLCIDNCGSGYRTADNKCEKCKVNGCGKCDSNLFECNFCISPKVLYGNNCYDICPIKTFLGSDRICYDCSKDCDICENGISCQKCMTPKVLQGKKCLDSCIDGYKALNGECKACTNSKCKNCDSSLNTCTECADGELLLNGDCVSPCPTGTYADGKQCSPCKKPCQRCKNLDYCSECEQGFLLNKDNKCVDKCDEGFVEVKKECKKCEDEGCAKCNSLDLTDCIQCDKTRVLLNGDCLLTCPDNYYNKNGECIKCLKGCKQCTSSIDCKQCEDDLFLKEGKSCEKECQDGWIQNDRSCVQCKGNCKKCKKEAINYCTECPLGLFLLDGNCLNSCPDKFWQDIDSCKPCLVSECAKCSVKGTICDKCSNGFFLNDNTCVNTCPEGKVLRDEICHKCEVTNCKKCPSDNTKSCLECNKNSILINSYLCDTTCPTGTFHKRSDNTCQNCISDCLNCEYSNSCNKCNNGFYLQEGVCVRECKDGYRQDSFRCVQCDIEGCSKCSENSCIYCKSPLVLSEGNCVTNCNQGFYLDKQTQSCNKCDLFCENCNSLEQCDKCAATKVLSNTGKCVDSCSDLSVKIGSKCEICQTEENCRKCNETNLTQCDICQPGYFLLNGLCYEACPSGYFTWNGTCRPCIENCEACKDDKTCERCSKDFYSLNNVCSKDCPMSYHKFDGICVPCADSSCETCTNEKCLKCLNESYLEDGLCEKQCSPGYFLFNFLECRRCEDNCLKCDNADTCTVCQAGYLLQNGDCVETCSAGYVQIDSECKPCNKGCTRCDANDTQNCLVCTSPLVLLNGKCVNNCGAGYFFDHSYEFCRPCMNDCDLCSDILSCNKCKAGLVYMPTTLKCQNQCDDGFRQENSDCIPCQLKDCKKCQTSIDICDECESSSYKLGDTCVTECDYEKGLFIHLSTKECKRCPFECKTCNEDHCKSCQIGFVLNNGKCDNKCDDGEVEVNQECLNCQNADCSVCQKNLVTCEKCKNGKLLLTLPKETNPSCVDFCPEGFFLNETKCESCSDNCKSCQDAQFCSECQSGFLLQNDKCVQTCNKGSVERNGKCVECTDKNCVICNNLLLDTCIKCEMPYKLLNGKCVADCTEGYFITKVGEMEVCSACLTNCQFCRNGESCDECKRDFSIKEGTCVESCGDNYILVGNQCQKCGQPECKTCSTANVNTCLECNSPFYLSDKATCISDCADSYFKRQNPTTACVACTDSNCLNCSPENMCHKCNQGFYLLNSNCVAKCPDGFYIDKTNECQSCQKKECSVCNLENSNECEVCKTGFHLYNKECVTVCPQGTFLNLANACQSCSGSCENCTSEINCLKCVTPFILDSNNSCNDSCKKGSIEISGKCEDCKDFEKCFKCDSKDVNVCLECSPEYFLYGASCVEVCPVGTFLEGRRCVDCEANCNECLNSTTCQKCSKLFFEYNADCVSQCKEGFTNVDGHCKECNDYGNCLKCKSDLLTCDECRKPLLVSNGLCLAKCEIGFVYDTSKLSCESCSANCEECENSSSCRKCKSSYFLDSNNSCVATCPDKHYLNTTTLRCEPFTNPNCHKCDVNDPSKCLECPADLLLLNGNDCVAECPEGTYKSTCTGVNVCANCSPQCKTCHEKSTCDSCNAPLAFANNDCVSTCAIGYVQRDTNCFKCQEDSCEICDSADLNKCLKCKEGILFNNLCIKECPVGFRLEDNRCVKCPTNCEECNEKVCTKCQANFYFNSLNECVTCYKPQLILNDRCEPCRVSGCSECDSSNSDKCKLCDTKFILFEDKCITECPQGFFKDNNSCSKCSTNCEVCSSLNECKQCVEPFLNYGGLCVEKCPDHFTNVNKKCEPCTQSECVECEDSLNRCKTCDNKTILFNSECVTSCPLGHFLNINKCDTCTKGCNQCDKDRCIECENGLKIKGTECVPECGEGYFDNTKACISCSDSNCLKCNPQNKCQQCNLATFLIESEGSCKNTCPDGLYSDSANRKCDKCDLGCEKCTDSKKCFQCLQGFFMYEGECHQSCPSGTTSLKDSCVKCTQEGCLECMPENPNKCLKCVEEKSLFNHNCENECPISTFEKNNECLPCDLKCLNCADENKCLNCKSEFKLNEGICQNECPDGKVLINGLCVSCASDKCKACSTDVNACINCVSPYKLYRHTCVVECPEGFKLDGVDKCVQCKDGCKSCNLDDTCNSCTIGYYLLNTQCVTQCTAGLYGDCDKNQCKTCDSACAECVGPSASNCVRCADNYFKDDKTCVKPTECPSGTYPNKSTGHCKNCDLTYCEKCSDENTCTQCVRGFTLKDGQCIVGKSYVNLINSISLSDEYSFTNKRLAEIFSVNSLGGTGVGSSNVSFTFWFRLLAPINEPVTVFNIKNESVSTFDYKFVINPKTEKCEFNIYTRTGEQIKSLEHENCSYQKISNWTFFLITVDKQGVDFLVTIKTLADKQSDPLNEWFTLLLKTGPVTEILEKNTSIELNDNNKRGVIQFFNFNLLDYHPKSQDIATFTQSPPECDYFCTECNKTCKKCIDTISPVDGFCSANEIRINNGVKIIDSNFKSINFELRSQVLESFTSTRYAFATYFYIDKSVNLKTTAVTIYSDSYSATNKSGLELNDLVIIQNGLITVNGEKNLTHSEIEVGEWYFLAVGFKSTEYKVWLYDRKGNELIKNNFNYEMTRTFLRLWDSYSFEFSPLSGSLLNTVVYINNIPDSFQIKKLVDDIICPNNCSKCGKTLNCEKCKSGYKLKNDGTCQNDVNINSEKVVGRIDLWNKESMNYDLTQVLNNTEWSFSFWMRKKVHSNVIPDSTNTHNLIGLKTKDGIASIITQSLKADYNSDIEFNTLSSNSTDTNSTNKYKWTRKFDEEVYDYIHIAVQIDNLNQDVIIDIKDFANNNTVTQKIKGIITSSETITNTLVIGDEKGMEVNMEITWLQIFPSTLDEESISKLRVKKPLDCDAGCISNCDYETGICGVCAVTKLKDKKCVNLLVGYTSSHIYGDNVDYSSVTDPEIYRNVLTSQGISTGVNSLAYSTIGYFYAFDYNNAKTKTNAKVRVFSLGNFKANSFSDDTGKNLIALDLLVENQKATVEFTINASGRKQSIKVENLTVEPLSWLAFNAGIDVTNKLFSYKIVNVLTKKEFSGKLTLTTFPEKLQQIGGITLLGPLDNLDLTSYVVPSLRLRSIFFIPNLGYDESLLTKFLAKFLIPADPKCPINCGLCLENSKKVVECLKCTKGYVKKSGQCQLDDSAVNYEYLVLSDKLVTQSTDFVVKDTKILNDVISVMFFVRKNYHNGSFRNIMTFGKIKVNMVSSKLSDAIELEIDGIATKLQVDFADPLIWHSVVIAIEKNKVILSVIKENKKSEILNSKVDINTILYESTDSLKFNTNNFEYQFNGVHLAARSTNKPTLKWPEVDCTIDCLFCISNKCQSCLYGRNSKGVCINKQVFFSSEDDYSSTKLTEYLPLNNNYRSNIYSVFFTVELKTEGMINLLKINNLKELNQQNQSGSHENHILINYETTSNKFLIGYSNRFVADKYLGAKITESSYLNKPQKTEHFVALSVNKSTITYVIFNTNDNYIKGSFQVEGELDYLTSNANFFFFGAKPADATTKPGIVKDIKFYYERALTIEELLEKAKRYTALVQPACATGTKFSCLSCSQGVLKQDICVPNQDTAVLISDNILPVSRWSNANTVYKYNFQKGTTLIENLNLSFYWKSTYLSMEKQGIIRLNLTDGTVKRSLFSLVFTPQNTLEIDYISGNTITKSVFTDFLKEDELYFWVYFNINVDFKNNKITISFINNKTNRNVEKEIKFQTVDNLAVEETKSVIYIEVGFTDEAQNLNDNLNFEMSYLTFMANNAIQGEELKQYKVLEPRELYAACKSNRVNSVCVKKDRMTQSFNIGDIMAGVEGVQKKEDLSHLSQVPLFRPLYYEATMTQTFQYYLVSFDLDVNQYLSSTYSRNKDILFVIHNDNKADYDTLSMNDLIPESLFKNGAISLVNDKGSLKIYNGYIPWNNSVYSYDVPLGGKPLTSYSKIYFSILVDVREKTLRMIVVADNILYSREFATVSYPSPLSYLSLIYNHPTIDRINLNLYSPRLEKDLNENAQPHLNTFYNGQCSGDKNCRNCHIPDNSNDVFCLDCKNGFKFYNNACNEEYYLNK